MIHVFSCWGLPTTPSNMSKKKDMFCISLGDHHRAALLTVAHGTAGPLEIPAISLSSAAQLRRGCSHSGRGLHPFIAHHVAFVK